MRFQVSEKDGVVLLSPRGKMMSGPKLDSFHNKIKELVRIGARRIVIDLGKVDWMGSQGIGVLVASKITLKGEAGELKLARITKKIQKIIAIAQLTQYFKNYDSVEDAVASFK